MVEAHLHYGQKYRKKRKGWSFNILFKGTTTMAWGFFLSHPFFKVLCRSLAYNMDVGEHTQITMAKWRITTVTVQQTDTSGPELILPFCWRMSCEHGLLYCFLITGYQLLFMVGTWDWDLEGSNLFFSLAFTLFHGRNLFLVLVPKMINKDHSIGFITWISRSMSLFCELLRGGGTLSTRPWTVGDF